MDAIELEQLILEKFRLLDEAKKLEILETIEQKLEDTKPMILGEWLDMAEAFQAELEAKYGSDYYFNSLSILDETHEERLNGLMGGE